jgi:alanine transaminase
MPCLRGGDTDSAEELDLAFSSNYLAADGSHRGFCNWLVPGRVMAGRYPHGTPFGTKTGSPSPEEARAHLRRLAAAGVGTFVCLQEEVPAQDDDGPDGWPGPDGVVPLGSAAARAKYPAGFRRYLPDAVDAARAEGRPAPRFVRLPITDFGVPDPAALLPAVEDLAAGVRNGEAAPYLHCWGGRGRAGTVGACLLLALRLGPPPSPAPAADDAAAAAALAAAADALDGAAAEAAEAAAAAALRTVQAGYATRAGEDGGGSLSPETEGQREFVRRFARLLVAARRGAAGPAVAGG